jgi:hypothetical protein
MFILNANEPEELAYLTTKWIQDGETIVSVSKPGGKYELCANRNGCTFLLLNNPEAMSRGTRR